MAPLDTSGSSRPGVGVLSNRVLTLLSLVSSRVLGTGWVSREATGGDTETRSPSSRYLPKQHRIQRRIDENGGRVYQQDLVESTDWSKSTVSRILREMEQSGAVVRLRVGREKVVCDPRCVPGGIDGDSTE